MFIKQSQDKLKLKNEKGFTSNSTINSQDLQDENWPFCTYLT